MAEAVGRLMYIAVGITVSVSIYGGPISRGLSSVPENARFFPRLQPATNHRKRQYYPLSEEPKGLESI